MRERILAAAAAVFARKGYHSASMDDIAAEAAVAKGSLYYHFRSKSTLFEQVAVTGMEELRQEISRAVDLPVPVGEKVAAAVDRISALCFEYPDLINLMISESPGGVEPESWQHISEVRKNLFSYLAGLLREGSEIERAIRPMDYMAATNALMHFIIAYWAGTNADDAAERERVRSDIREIVMRGVMVNPDCHT